MSVHKGYDFNNVLFQGSKTECVEFLQSIGKVAYYMSYENYTAYGVGEQPNKELYCIKN